MYKRLFFLLVISIVFFQINAMKDYSDKDDSAVLTMKVKFGLFELKISCDKCDFSLLFNDWGNVTSYEGLVFELFRHLKPNEIVPIKLFICLGNIVLTDKSVNFIQELFLNKHEIVSKIKKVIFCKKHFDDEFCTRNVIEFQSKCKAYLKDKNVSIPGLTKGSIILSSIDCCS